MSGKAIFTGPVQSKPVMADVKLNLTRALIGCFVVKRFLTIKVDSCENTLFEVNLPKRFRGISTKLGTLQRPLRLANSNSGKILINAVNILLGNGTLSAILNEFAKQKDL